MQVIEGYDNIPIERLTAEQLYAILARNLSETEPALKVLPAPRSKA
jgi:hypothetical protein